MRAVRLVGGPSGPAPGVVDVPAPGPPSGTELLVRVVASSVNGTDLGLVRGGRAVRALSLGRVAPGFDLAGEVAACGTEVTGFGVGDRVVALLGHAGGAQAELVLLPQARVARAPSSVDLQTAAALPLAGLTALQALHGRAGLHARRAPRVLVVGAAGGIGCFAVQLARLAGAHVTAVADEQRAQFLHGLGADVVVDRRTQDVLTLGERWDVVLDTPGALRSSAVRPCLAPDGVLVSTRPLSPDAVRALVQRRGPRRSAVATRRSPVDLARLAHLVDTGRLRIRSTASPGSRRWRPRTSTRRPGACAARSWSPWRRSGSRRSADAGRVLQAAHAGCSTVHLARDSADARPPDVELLRSAPQVDGGAAASARRPQDPQAVETWRTP